MMKEYEEWQANALVRQQEREQRRAERIASGEEDADMQVGAVRAERKIAADDDDEDRPPANEEEAEAFESKRKKRRAQRAEKVLSVLVE